MRRTNGGCCRRDERTLANCLEMRLAAEKGTGGAAYFLRQAKAVERF